jgi:hypothetical protein
MIATNTGRTLLLVLAMLASSAPLAAEVRAGEKRAVPVGVGDIAPDFTLEDQRLSAA